MASVLFSALTRFRAPVCIAMSAGYFAYDTWRMKGEKESEICVTIGNLPIRGVLGDVPCVSPPLQKLIDEVYSKLNLTKAKKSLLNYYTTPYPRPKIHGYGSSFSRIDIFLPDYFNIFHSEELTALAIHDIIEVMGENFESLDKDDWLTPDGKAFINSFILSEKAKKFVIAQESYANMNPEYYFKYFIFTLCVMTWLVSASLIDQKIAGNGSLKIAVGLGVVLPVALLKSLLSSHAYLMCDLKGLAQAISRNMLTYKEMIKTQDATMIDEEMLQGALEYYTKLLQRNRAAARLFSSGSKIFRPLSQDGDSLDPFTLEIPKKEAVQQLERIKSLVDRAKSANDPAVKDSQNSS